MGVPSAALLDEMWAMKETVCLVRDRTKVGLAGPLEGVRTALPHGTVDLLAPGRGPDAPELSGREGRSA